MLNFDARKYEPTFKDVGSAQPLVGCGTCADRVLCGKLHLNDTGALLLSCMSYCTCADPSKCDFVCPSKPEEFVARHREVDGWDLCTIPVARMAPLPHLPDWIPMFQGNLLGKRGATIDGCVALPLTYALMGRGQVTRARTAIELTRSYGVRPRRGWVLSGVEDDPAVERIWPLHDVSHIARQLVHAGAIFASSPNFSTVLDCPRYDNFHAMKRIAWVWYHMTQGGLCTALHVNGRTDRDFERWAEFIRKQPAVMAIAFEFLTGTSTKKTVDACLRRLAELKEAVGRDLVLVVRGNAEAAQKLRSRFEQVIFIDSTAYMRASKRRKAYIQGNGKLAYLQVRTRSTQQTSALLRHNIETLRKAALSPPLAEPMSPQLALDFSELPPQQEAHNETTQRSLFSQQEV